LSEEIVRVDSIKHEVERKSNPNPRQSEGGGRVVEKERGKTEEGGEQRGTLNRRVSSGKRSEMKKRHKRRRKTKGGVREKEQWKRQRNRDWTLPNDEKKGQGKEKGGDDDFPTMGRAKCH